MRSRDLGEQYREGLEQVIPGLRWAQVIDILDEQEVTATDPVTLESQQVTITPPRSLLVQFLDAIGGLSSIPFLEPWGVTSLPPIGTRVLVCQTGSEGPVALGFYTPGYLAKQQLGEFGEMIPGERTTYSRAHRLRILDNYGDAGNANPSEADLDVDVIVGRRDQTIAPPEEELDSYSFANLSWQDFKTNWTENVWRDTLAQFPDRLEEDYVNALNRQQSVFLSQTVGPQYTLAVRNYLADSNTDNFITILKTFVSTGAWSTISAEVIAVGYDAWIAPVVDNVLQDWVRGKIADWPGLDNSLRTSLLNTFNVKAAEQLNALRNIYTGRVLRLMEEKVRSYIVSLIEDRMSNQRDIVTQEALRLIRAKWLGDASKSVKDWIKQGLILEDRFVDVTRTQEIAALTSEIARQINEGIVDPEALPVYDVTIQSRQSNQTAFAKERKFRAKVSDDGSCSLEVDSGHKITLRYDGTAIIEVRDLIITGDAIRVTTENADVIVDDMATISAGEAKVLVENNAQVKVNKDAQISVDGSLDAKVKGRTVLDSPDVRLGEEGGVSSVALNADDTSLGSELNALLTAMVSAIGGLVPTSAAALGTLLQNVQLSDRVGSVKASAKRVKAK